MLGLGLWQALSTLAPPGPSLWGRQKGLTLGKESTLAEWFRLRLPLFLKPKPFPQLPLAHLRLVALSGVVNQQSPLVLKQRDLSLTLSTRVTLGINLSDLGFLTCKRRKRIIPTSGLLQGLHERGLC